MVDGFILFYVFVMFFIGFSRGTLHQIWTLAVLMVATYVSGVFSPFLATFLNAYIPNTVVCKLIGFAVLFGAIGAVLNAVQGFILHRRGRWDERSGFADRSIGSILAIVEAVGTIEVAAAVLVAYPLLGLDTMIESSQLLSIFFGHVPTMLYLLPANFQRILQVIT